MLSARAALLLIDVQQAFDDARWGPRNNLDAERNVARLLTAWRAAGRTVLHVRHLSRQSNSPLRADQPGCEFKPEARPEPGEPLFEKSVNSAFIGTGLEEHLRAHDIDTLVCAGITTDHCVSTTARMAANLGFETFVVSDATFTFDRQGFDGKSYLAQQVHDLALASLHDEFATVLGTDAVLDQIGESESRAR